MAKQNGYGLDDGGIESGSGTVSMFRKLNDIHISRVCVYVSSHCVAVGGVN